jgi:hypothetical protein
MKLNQSKAKIGGLILAFFVAIGITAISSSTAQAQWRREDNQNRADRNQDYRRNRDTRREEAQRRDRNRRDDRYRRNGDYNRNGNYGVYGQNGGYGVYGRNGGYGNYGSQASINEGYQAGISTGASDAQRGQSYNPQRSHYYRNPPNSYGNQQGFRQGFVRGYAEGYQRYGGYNRGRNTGSWFPW